MNFGQDVWVYIISLIKDPKSFHSLSLVNKFMWEICRQFSLKKRKQFLRRIWSNTQLYYILPNGNLDGLYQAYHINGRLWKIVNYTNGRANGPCQYFSLRGDLISVDYYTDGKKEGVCKTFWRDGTLRTQKTYYQGLPNGPSYMFYNDGRTLIEENFVNGKKDGIYREFDENGNCVKMLKYSSGKVNFWGILRYRIMSIFDL